MTLLSIITPEFGLFFWSTLIFLVFFFILRRFAWKPIINALNQREESINDALSQAQKARDEMQQLNADNEALLKEARQERDAIIREANEIKDRIIADAKAAAVEAETVEREKTRQLIENEKRSALAEIRDTAAAISVEVAEKILRKEFANKGTQEEFAKTLITELSDN
ncbi:MAG: F0F1 ATP synthase subunit B [Bacteroidota bacterium]